MISSKSIQFKAAFLLVVFSLNTLVGFACSIGINMGFNTTHHEGDIAKAQVHMHKDGKKHVHKETTHKKHEHKENAGKKDDCCKEKVVTLQTADKNLVYHQTVINPPVINLSCTFYQLPVSKIIKGKTKEYIACQFHPPPRDILIAIQRFQI